ncbi:MAG TPA: hypothetical protein VNH15_03900 [Elusimicrobiota bacterium]|nr:hypothetical protein [Elusimicrobiota bacterium]
MKRLFSLETNAFAFISIIITVLSGLGYIYTRAAGPTAIIFASLGALAVLGFGISYVQASAYSYRQIQLVSSALEIRFGLQRILEMEGSKWLLTPDKVAAPTCCPGLWFIPEMLRVQLYFYAVLSIGVVVTALFWLHRHFCMCVVLQDFGVGILLVVLLLISLFIICQNYVLRKKLYKFASKGLKPT